MKPLDGVRIDPAFAGMGRSEIKMLLHIAQPGVMASSSSTSGEALAMLNLAGRGLARIREESDIDGVVRVKVSITLRGEELARYLERLHLGIA